MKKSAILETLKDVMVSYNVFTDTTGYRWLEVIVKEIRWKHIIRLQEVILNIEALKENEMQINFDGNVEID